VVGRGVDRGGCLRSGGAGAVLAAAVVFFALLTAFPAVPRQLLAGAPGWMRCTVAHVGRGADRGGGFGSASGGWTRAMAARGPAGRTVGRLPPPVAHPRGGRGVAPAGSRRGLAKAGRRWVRAGHGTDQLHKEVLDESGEGRGGHAGPNDVICVKTTWPVVPPMPRPRRRLPGVAGRRPDTRAGSGTVLVRHRFWFCRGGSAAADRSPSGRSPPGGAFGQSSAPPLALPRRSEDGPSRGPSRGGSAAGRGRRWHAAPREQERRPA